MHDWLKPEVITDDNGNLKLIGNYDLAAELVHNITERKETLWKRFCQDVCEKMVAYYAEDSIDVIHFHKAFNEKFNETILEWEADESKPNT